MVKIYEFYTELRDSNPKIFRTIQVISKITVAEFVYILLSLYDMQATHLFKVIVPKGQTLVEAYKRKIGNDFDEVTFKNEHPDISNVRYRYELLDIIDDFPERENDVVLNVTKEKLKQAISIIGEQMVLWYDFGDDWFVDIKLINIIETEDDVITPNVLKGAGFGIIEDCGGSWRLNDIIIAFQNKKGKLYKEICDWLDIDDFDFSKFDIDEMNKRLQVIPQIYKRSYEKKIVPSQEEIDYIERRY